MGAGGCLPEGHEPGGSAKSLVSRLGGGRRRESHTRTGGRPQNKRAGEVSVCKVFYFDGTRNSADAVRCQVHSIHENSAGRWRKCTPSGSPCSLSFRKILFTKKKRQQSRKNDFPNKCTKTEDSQRNQDYLPAITTLQTITCLWGTPVRTPEDVHGRRRGRGSKRTQCGRRHTGLPGAEGPQWAANTGFHFTV